MNDEWKQEYLEAFGVRVRELRKERGWTQEELATRCGYTSDTRKSTINKIEAGRSDLPTSKVRALADALGVKACDLMNFPSKIQNEQKLCNLFTDCHGSTAYETVQQFLKLDANDRQAVRTMIESLLSTEKYQKEPSSALFA